MTTPVLNLRQKLRSAHVKRWHIVETVRAQTVAEHSFNVLLIAEEIGRLLKLPEEQICRIRTYAIHHDIPEVVIGDMPTPTKKIVSHQYSLYMDSMRAVDPDSIPANQEVYDVVKLADTIDAICFVTTYGIGKHSLLVRNMLVLQAEQFMEEAFFKSCDAIHNLFDEMIVWDTSYDSGEGVIWPQQQE